MRLEWNHAGAWYLVTHSIKPNFHYYYPSSRPSSTISHLSAPIGLLTSPLTSNLAFLQDILHMAAERFRKTQIWDFPCGPVVKNPLPKQETRVWSLVWEDSTCLRKTKPKCHNYWACALEPTGCNYGARMPRARAPSEKPPQWEALCTARKSRN